MVKNVQKVDKSSEYVERVKMRVSVLLDLEGLCARRLSTV